MKKKRERTQISKIRNERDGVTDTKAIQKIVRKYYELDNLYEMDEFLETYNLPKLNQEESENLNRHITTSEIKAVIKKLSTDKSPGPNDFTG